MQTRLIHYFLALEKEKHFGRAAELCNVSQPTLSAGIARLEEELGKRLILRDRKFAGLTAEGAAILPWARQMIAAQDGMAQAAGRARGPLQGELRLGVVPAAMPAVGFIGAALLARHPEVNISVRALTSRQIERDLAAFEIDAGLTYLDFEPPAHSLSVPLYTEHYLLVGAAEGGSAQSDGSAARPVDWEEAARYPLCLLHQGMQNRRILDANLARRGLALRPVVTADSYIALLALVRQGRLHSIIPDSHGLLLDGLRWARMTPLAPMEGGSRIGIIVSDRSPLGALAEAVIQLIRDTPLPPEFGAP